MTEEGKHRAAADLIYLAGCAVNEIKPDMRRVEEMDLEPVHDLALSLSLNASTYLTLAEAYEGNLPDIPLFQKWKEETDFVLYKEMRMDQERQALFFWMADHKIWHLPLKGILLKELYPRRGMRQMADNDILFDVNGQEQVHSWFLKRGFEAEDYRKGLHDKYFKKPFYNFEMHTALFSYMSDPLFQEYYRNVKARLLPVPGKKYEYCFGDEDFYVYMTAHNCKHYRNGGTGLRSLLDVFVYLRAKGDSLDWDLIGQEIKKLGITDYESQTRNLAEKLFGDPSQFSWDLLSEREQIFLDEHVTLGTYGTIENQIKNRLQKIESDENITSGRAKLHYIRQRFFPEPEFFQAYYPFFYRHRVLLPIGYIYRLIYGGIKNRKKLSSEAKALRKF